MKKQKEKKSPAKILKRIFLVIIIIIVIFVAACGIYIGNYYHADQTALEYAQASTATVTIDTSHKGQIAFLPDQATTGIIFYPGGKVQYEAYAPLLSSLADQGILCVLVHMPGNLAVFDVNAADGIQEQYPEIDHWYLAGHSLGGAMAGAYLADHADEYDGVIFLAAFTTSDLSQTDLRALTIYGSNDQVLSLDSYEKNMANLPKDHTEYVISGGCHSYFGSYGAQKGDGIPTISQEEQWNQTVQEIINWLP